MYNSQIALGARIGGWSKRCLLALDAALVVPVEPANSHSKLNRRASSNRVLHACAREELGEDCVELIEGAKANVPRPTTTAGIVRPCQELPPGPGQDLLVDDAHYPSRPSFDRLRHQ